MKAFSIAIDDAVIDHIVRRVGAFPFEVLTQIPGDDDWCYGPHRSFLLEFCRYWTDNFDWSGPEAQLNRFSQFIVPVQGQELHFVHESGSGASPQPLLLLHGWPYSFASFALIVERLAHPERFGGRSEDAFTVVIPSLPGFAFSSKPAISVSPRTIAGLMNDFMRDVLGYRDYLVHGGDGGGYIAGLRALDYPDSVAGVHLTFVALREKSLLLQSGETGGAASAEEKAFVEKEVRLGKQEGAYAQLQSSRPSALAPAMLDSPVGIAAWMLDKFYHWSDRRAHRFEDLFSMDRLLTEIMVYIVTGTFQSSARLYANSQAAGFISLEPGQRVDVPTAVAAFPDPVFPVPPRSMVERCYNLVRYTTMPRGGHFPFLETPDLLSEDLLQFGASLRA